jgi:galactoside O-acetyltransferase
MATSFYSEAELLAMGFKSIGKKCQISRKASFYGISHMEIGNNVRIDDFCIISGNVKLGSNIHISAYVALYGANGIELEDYTGISPRTTIYSAVDDFGGDYLIGPIHPEGTTNVKGGKVLIKRYVQLASNCVVFPNLVIEEGTVVGACSMVRHSLEPWSVYYGIPVKRIRERNKGLLKFLY